MALTSQQYQYTPEELDMITSKGADAAMKAYNARIASLRAETSTPTTTATTTPKVDVASVKKTLDEAAKVTGITNIADIPDKQAEAERLRKEIESIQSQIASKQSMIEKAEEAGLEPDEPIPSDLMTGETPMDGYAPTPEELSNVMKDIVSGTSGADDYYQLLSEQLRGETARRDEIAKEQAGALEKVKDFFSTRPTPEQLEEDARKRFLERYGLPADWEAKQMQQYLGMQSEIVNLRNEYNEIELREQQTLMTSEQRMAPTTFIRGEQALIQRQFAMEKVAVSTELSAKAAEAELYAGNIEMADRYIKDYIQVATYDLSQKQEELTFFMSYYSEQYNALDTNIKSTIQDILSFTEKEKALKQNELQQKWSYVVDAATKGINLNLSGSEIQKMGVDEIAEMYSTKVATAVATEAAQTGIVTYTPTQKLSLEQAGLLNASRDEQLDHLARQGFLGQDILEFEGHLSDAAVVVNEIVNSDMTRAEKNEKLEKMKSEMLVRFADDTGAVRRINALFAPHIKEPSTLESTLEALEEIRKKEETISTHEEGFFRKIWEGIKFWE